MLGREEERPSVEAVMDGYFIIFAPGGEPTSCIFFEKPKSSDEWDISEGEENDEK